MQDARRIQVVCNGLPLRNGEYFAVDALGRDGQQPQADKMGKLNPSPAIGNDRSSCTRTFVATVAPASCQTVAAARSSGMLRGCKCPGLSLADSRRIEVLAKGWRLWQRTQVAVDTALVCPVLKPCAEREPGAYSRPPQKAGCVITQSSSPRGSASL